MARQTALPELVEPEPDNLDNLSELDRDARELRQIVTQGGYRLGLLCARCVHIGEHGGDRKSEDGSSSILELETGKVTVAEFAERSGVSESKIRRYYRAWELAAEQGICAKPSELTPGMEDDAGIGQWDDDNDDDEEQRQKWSYWLNKAEKPKKEKKPEPTSDNEQKKKKEPEPEAPKKEVAEVDSELIRNELLELLESTRALTLKLSKVISSTENELLTQIASAALDLNSTANALVAQTQSAE